MFFNEEDETRVLFRKIILPTIENVLNGFNSTIFAYGMTGAGKTYTMFGDIYNTSVWLNNFLKFFKDIN